MGHADISTTAKFYNKVDKEHLNKAKEIMNYLLKVKTENADTDTTDHFTDHFDNSESHQEKSTPKNSDFSPESQYPRCDSNAQPLAPEANALSN